MVTWESPGAVSLKTWIPLHPAPYKPGDFGRPFSSVSLPSSSTKWGVGEMWAEGRIRPLSSVNLNLIWLRAYRTAWPVKLLFRVTRLKKAIKTVASMRKKLWANLFEKSSKNTHLKYVICFNYLEAQEEGGRILPAWKNAVASKWIPTGCFKMPKRTAVLKSESQPTVPAQEGEPDTPARLPFLQVWGTAPFPKPAPQNSLWVPR